MFIFATSIKTLTKLSGGRFHGSVSCGIEVQISTQCLSSLKDSPQFHAVVYSVKISAAAAAALKLWSIFSGYLELLKVEIEENSKARGTDIYMIVRRDYHSTRDLCIYCLDVFMYREQCSLRSTTRETENDPGPYRHFILQHAPKTTLLYGK